MTPHEALEGVLRDSTAAQNEAKRLSKKLESAAAAEQHLRTDLENCRSRCQQLQHELGQRDEAALAAGKTIDAQATRIRTQQSQIDGLRTALRQDALREVGIEQDTDPVKTLTPYTGAAPLRAYELLIVHRWDRHQVVLDDGSAQIPIGPLFELEQNAIGLLTQMVSTLSRLVGHPPRRAGHDGDAQATLLLDWEESDDGVEAASAAGGHRYTVTVELDSDSVPRIVAEADSELWMDGKYFDSLTDAMEHCGRHEARMRAGTTSEATVQRGS